MRTVLQVSQISQRFQLGLNAHNVVGHLQSRDRGGSIGDGYEIIVPIQINPVIELIFGRFAASRYKNIVFRRSRDRSFLFRMDQNILCDESFVHRLQFLAVYLERICSVERISMFGFSKSGVLERSVDLFIIVVHRIAPAWRTLCDQDMVLCGALSIGIFWYSPSSGGGRSMPGLQTAALPNHWEHLGMRIYFCQTPCFYLRNRDFPVRQRSTSDFRSHPQSPRRLEATRLFETLTPDKRRRARSLSPPVGPRSSPNNRRSGAGSSNSCGASRRSA